MNKKTIIFVATTVYSTNTALRTHIIHLSNKYNILLCTNLNFGTLYAEIPTHAKIVHIDIQRKISPYYDIKTLLQILNVIFMVSPSAIHSVTPKGGLLAMAAGFICCVPCRFHTFTGQVWENKNGIWRSFLKFFDRLICFLSTSVFTDSHSQCKFLSEERIVRTNSISVLGGGSVAGVDTERFYPSHLQRLQLRSDVKVSDDAPVYLFVGRIARDKGVYDFLHAFSEIHRKNCNARLWIVGPDEEKILERIKDDPFELPPGVTWFGSDDEPEKYMMAADVLLMPSYREGFSTTIIEAASCGIATIGYFIKGIFDPVENGSTGLLVEKGNVEQLTSAMAQLITDPGYFKIMGHNARKRVENDFSSSYVSNAWLRMYEEKVGF